MEEGTVKYLIIPGLGNSGEKHWQSFWEKKLKGSKRVVQDDWENPDLENWLRNLEKEIERCDDKIILIAHSLGVALVLQWAYRNMNNKVVGALLVSPSDVDSKEHTPECVRNFSPMPIIKLPFHSIVVASEDDPYVSISRAEYFAKNWNSNFTNIGKSGHINSDSNLGEWEEGLRILEKLISSLRSPSPSSIM